MRSPHPELQRLNVFVGTWKTRGQLKLTDELFAEINGTDRYEWLAGEYFMIHHIIDVQMGEDIINGIEIIGYDESKQQFFMHSYDNQGNKGIMHAFVKNDIWNFLNKSTRFTGTFSNDGQTLNGQWENSADGKNWRLWMNITLVKSGDL